MFVWRSWVTTTTKTNLFGDTSKNYKVYKMLLLFGFIPLFISIDGKGK